MKQMGGSKGGGIIATIGGLILMLAVFLRTDTGGDYQRRPPSESHKSNPGAPPEFAKAKPNPTPNNTPPPSADTDGDGVVSPDELAEWQQNADQDGDGNVSSEERDAWLSSLPPGSRGQEGALNFTSYGQVNDSTPDSNTLARRGFANNLLREGSVALSPDIYNTYRPAIGSAVYVNGVHVGYYEDRTPDSYNGKSYGNTIDVYDPNNKVGPILKSMSNGSYTISFGPPREQISNP